MEKWKATLRLVAGISLNLILMIYGAARLVLDLIGYTTAPDDAKLLAERLPALLSWLFTTPWWVPAVILLAGTSLSIWLIYNGVQNVAAIKIDEIPGSLEMIRGDVEQLKMLPAEMLSINTRINEISNGVDQAYWLVRNEQNEREMAGSIAKQEIQMDISILQRELRHDLATATGQLHDSISEVLTELQSQRRNPDS